MRLYTLKEWKEKGMMGQTVTYRVLIKAMIKAECLNSVQTLIKFMLHQPNYSV